MVGGLEFQLEIVDDRVFAHVLGVVSDPVTNRELQRRPLLLGSKLPYTGVRHCPGLLKRLTAIRSMTNTDNALDYFTPPNHFAPELDLLDELYAVSALVQTAAALDPRIKGDPPGDRHIVFVGADPMDLSTMQKVYTLTKDIWKKWTVGPLEHAYAIIHDKADPRPRVQHYWAERI